MIVFAAIAAAQDAPEAGSKTIPLSKVERKDKAPVSREVLRVKLPKAAEFKLSNGLTVLLLEDHRLPLVTARLLVEGAGRTRRSLRSAGLAEHDGGHVERGHADAFEQADRRRD